MTVNAQTLGRRLWKDRYAYLFLLPGYSIFLVLVFIPLIAGIWISFFRTDYITFTWVGLGNYETLFTTPHYVKIFRNTFSYVLILVPVAVSTSLLLALLMLALRVCALARSRAPVRATQ